MSYRYDREKKNQRITYIVSGTLLLLVLFTPVYRWVFGSLQTALVQTWENKNDITADAGNFFQSFAAKQSILEKNQELQREIDRLEVDNLRTRYLADQLEKVTLLDKENVTVGTILSYGSLGSYDHIIVNQGEQSDVAIGDTVVLADNILIGYVSEVYSQTARVRLYADTEQSVNGILYPHAATLAAQGNGGGNFLIETPRDIDVTEGDIFYSLSQPGNIIAVVRSVEFDPRDPFKKTYLSYPVNLKEHQIVGIQKQTSNSETE